MGFGVAFRRYQERCFGVFGEAGLDNPASFLDVGRDHREDGDLGEVSVDPDFYASTVAISGSDVDPIFWTPISQQTRCTT